MASADDDFRKYQVAYVCRSTALVMSVLPTWWIDHVHVSMSMYLGLMSAVTVLVMVIDLPLSYLADRMGARLSYGVGLCVFSLSFLFVALASSPVFFIAYVCSNTLAEGLMSGADGALLRSIVGHDDYRKSMYRLSTWFYLLTSVLFFAGIGLYLFDPVLLFSLQAALILVAGICVLTISVNAKGAQRHAGREPGAGRRVSLRQLVLNADNRSGCIRYLVGLVMICVAYGLFNGYVQFQNRTIQLLSGSFSIAGVDPLWTVAMFLFAGNLITVIGVGRSVERLLNRLAFRHVTLILLGILALSTMLLASDNSMLVLVGYLLVCILKGNYRAEYSDMAMKSSPFVGQTALWFSTVNTVANLIASLINFLISLVATDDVQSMQTYWLWCAVALALLSLPMLAYAGKARLPYPGAGTSGKRSYLTFHLDSHNATEFTQVHPQGFDCDAFVRQYDAFRQVYDRHMPRIDATRSSGDHVTYAIVDGSNLLSVPPRQRMAALLDAGLQDLLETRPSADSSRKESSDAGTTAQTNLNRLCATCCDCMTYSHGDMVPGNILIADDTIVLVDWDRMAIAPRLLDEFSIVFHPDLPCDMPTRMRLMESLRAAHDPDCPSRKVEPSEIVLRLIDAAIGDCLSRRDTVARRLAQQYTELKEELLRMHDRC
ncbi:MFS transporter [Bifidobacterium samirii]|uniref:Choline/ethanolamine kinase n=1 Tax=Bifidobacterium samirii TaxID=2306974 RepID=A0A430FWZ2_9BIFI|nr:MFS transporter [Bifidobacterium samirii]RSX58799.1 choline/ethanolamine kinase [Bifidobacterium samirii]